MQPVNMMEPDDNSSDDGRMGRDLRPRGRIKGRFSSKLFGGEKQLLFASPRCKPPQEMADASPGSQVSANRDLLTSLKAARRRRDKIVGKRVVVFHQRKNYRYQRDTVRKAQNKFFLAAKNLRVFLSRQDINAATCTEYLQFEEAFSEMGKLNKSLNEVEAKLQQVDKDLDLRELKLSVDEKRIFKALRKLADFSPSHSQVRPPRPPSTHSSSSTSTARTDPRASKYYERAGAVKILRERLHNKQVQHLQDLSTRQIELELGRPLRPPEKTFQNTYYAELIALYGDLQTAKKESAAFRQECIEHDVALSDDEDSHNHSEALHFPLDLDRQFVHHVATRENVEERTALLSEFLSGYKDPKAKVAEWLTELPLRTRTHEIDSPGVQHLDEHPIDLDTEAGHSQPPTSRMYQDASNHRTSMLPAVSSAQGPADEDFRNWSLASSKRSRPISQRSHDFVGEAPERRYSDNMQQRPKFITCEEFNVPRIDQRRSSSASGP